MNPFYDKDIDEAAVSVGPVLGTIGAGKSTPAVESSPAPEATEDEQVGHRGMEKLRVSRQDHPELVAISAQPTVALVLPSLPANSLPQEDDPR